MKSKDIFITTLQPKRLLHIIKLINNCKKFICHITTISFVNSLYLDVRKIVRKTFLLHYIIIADHIAILHDDVYRIALKMCLHASLLMYTSYKTHPLDGKIGYICELWQ